MYYMLSYNVVCCFACVRYDTMCYAPLSCVPRCYITVVVCRAVLYHAYSKAPNVPRP